MLKLTSFYEGHGGAVLSLTGDTADNVFYSSGSEGLIVRWRRDLPNEGHVIIKLSGYIASVAFDKMNQTLFAAVNHKGIYVIDEYKRVVIKHIEMPAESFEALCISDKYIILTTKKAEILVLDKTSFKIVKRIETGLAEFSKLAIMSHNLWYSDQNGLQHLDLNKIEEKGARIKLKGRVVSLAHLDGNLIASTDHKILRWTLDKLRDFQEVVNPEIDFFTRLIVNSKLNTVYALSTNNNLYEYELSKKRLHFIKKVEILHNGKINDLVWIENYKFVISAGANTKIGVWQYN